MKEMGPKREWAGSMLEPGKGHMGPKGKRGSPENKEKGRARRKMSPKGEKRVELQRKSRGHKKEKKDPSEHIRENATASRKC